MKERKKNSSVSVMFSPRGGKIPMHCTNGSGDKQSILKMTRKCTRKLKVLLNSYIPTRS